MFNREISSMNRGSGTRRKVFNPLPQDVDPIEPIYVRLEAGYSAPRFERRVHVEDLVEILGDLIMTNATDQEASDQSIKWEVVARCWHAEWDMLDQSYVDLVRNKAINGPTHFDGDSFNGNASFWVLGKDLEQVYNVLADAGIFLNVGDYTWVPTKKGKICDCCFNNDEKNYRILIADGPSDPYDEGSLPIGNDPTASKEENKRLILRRLGAIGDLIGTKQAEKIASLDILNIQEVHCPNNSVRQCHCIVALDKAVIKAVEKRLKDAGYSIK